MAITIIKYQSELIDALSSIAMYLKDHPDCLEEMDYRRIVSMRNQLLEEE